MGRSKSKKSSEKKPAVQEKPEVEEEEEDEVYGEDEEDEDEEDEDVEGEDDEEEIELLKVETGDVVKVKQVLDESVAGTFLDVCFIRENHFMDNLKLSVMTIACAFASVAQFAPFNFPDSRIVLGSCCILYFVFSGVLQIITTFFDKDAIMITKPVKKEEMQQDFEAKKKRLLEEQQHEAKKSGGDLRGKNKDDAIVVDPPPSISNSDMYKYGLRIRTALPRYSQYYTVVIQFQNREDSPFVQQTWSVGQFFDKEGTFDEMGVMEEIEILFKRFAAGKYDKESKRDEHLLKGMSAKIQNALFSTSASSMPPPSLMVSQKKKVQ